MVGAISVQSAGGNAAARSKAGQRSARHHQGGVMSSDAGSATLDPRAATDDDVVLHAVDISKTYGVTRALKGVNFEVRRGKVTVLFGENGAGKSTLMKILSGVEQPTGGQLILDGEPVELTSTNDAVARGHLDHPPGAEPLRQPERPRQHLHRPRAADPDRRDRLRPGARDHPAADGPARGADQAGHPGPGPAGGSAADHRDRPRPGRRRPHPDHGRADLGAERERGRGLVQGHPGPDQPTAWPSSTSPTTWRKRSRSPTTRWSSATAIWWPPRTRRTSTCPGWSGRWSAGRPTTTSATSRGTTATWPCRSRASRSPSWTPAGSWSTTSRWMCARARSSACTA